MDTQEEKDAALPENSASGGILFAIMTGIMVGLMVPLPGWRLPLGILTGSVIFAVVLSVYVAVARIEHRILENTNALLRLSIALQQKK